MLGFTGPIGAGWAPAAYPEGVRHFWVGNRTGTSPGKGTTGKNPFPTLERALKAAANSGIQGLGTGQANDGCVIHLMNGFDQAITAADFFSDLASTDITIVGEGNAKLRWTAAAATFLFDKAGLKLRNLTLEFCDTAANATIAAPITVSAARCGIEFCDINVGTTAARFCTTGITVAAGADDFTFRSNRLYGLVAAEPADCIKVTATVNRLRIENNHMHACAATTGDGLINFTGAALALSVRNNVIVSLKAASTKGIKGVASMTGAIAENLIGIQAATGGASAITLGGSAGLHLALNYGACPGTTGILIGSASS